MKGWSRFASVWVLPFVVMSVPASAQLSELSAITTPLDGEVLYASVEDGLAAYIRRDPETGVRSVFIWTREADGRFTFTQEIDGPVATRIYLVGGKLLVPHPSSGDWNVYSRVGDTFAITQTLAVGFSTPWSSAIDGNTLAIARGQRLLTIRVDVTATTTEAPPWWEDIYRVAIDDDVVAILSQNSVGVFRHVAGGLEWDPIIHFPDPPGEDEQLIVDEEFPLNLHGGILRFVMEDLWSGTLIPATYVFEETTGEWERQSRCDRVATPGDPPSACSDHEDCIGSRCVDLSWPSITYLWPQRSDVAIRPRFGHVGERVIWDWVGARWEARGVFPGAVGMPDEHAIDATSFVARGIAYTICGAGECASPLSLGSACADDAMCASGACADGVCCESACDGECEACDAAGTCAPVTGADDSCAVCDAGTCLDSGALGTACADDAECGSGFCVDGFCCERACRGLCKACDVAGEEGMCTAVSGAPHGEREGCATCDAGVCTDDGSLSALGTMCTEDAACESGSCVDGFCCERACRGLCKACDVPGSEGMCTPVSGAPHGDRAGCVTCDEGVCVDDGSSGSLGDVCATADGCESGHCVDGVCCERACTGACKACGEPGSEGLCTAISGAPRGDRDGCLSCSAGVCVGAAPLGDACSNNGECESGQCVDGVCCERACRGTCKACNVAGMEGQCEPISGDPVGMREGCTTCMTGVCIEASALDGTCVGTFDECEVSMSARIAGGELERDVLAEHRRIEREVMLDRADVRGPDGPLCAASARTSDSGIIWFALLFVSVARVRRKRA